jgi:protein TonB
MLVIALPLGGAAYSMNAPLHARVVVDDAPASALKSANPNDTIPPKIANMKAVFDMLYTTAPAAGSTGSNAVWLNIYVGANGTAARQVIGTSSGNANLDSAALRIARSIQFVPAIYQGRRVPSWTSVRLTFASDPAQVAITTVGEGVDRFPPSLTTDRTVTKRTTSATAGAQNSTGVFDTTAHVATGSSVSVDTVVHIQRSTSSEPIVAGSYEIRDGKLVSLNGSPAAFEFAPIAASGSRAGVAQTGDPVSQQPFVTPMTVVPKIINQPEVEAAIADNYPRLLRDAGIGGKTVIWFYIGADGRTITQRIQTSSGYATLDDAAMRVAPTLQFTPAENQGKKVAVWVQIPIVFTTAQQSMRVDTARRVTSAVQQNMRATAERPTLSPMTVAPKLLNLPEVEVAISDAYPAMLRDAGIGGKTVVWFFIDENGRAVKMQVNTSSGYDALDRAALTVAKVLRFTPAEYKGRAIPVWVQIPIVFSVK